MREWTYSSTILDLSPLYHRRKSRQYTLDKGLDGPHNRSEPCGVEKNLLPLLGVFYRMFPNKILYSFLVSKMVATCPAYHRLLDFIMRTKLGDVYKSQVDLYIIS
jgi:hypothetical protein